MRSLTLFRFSKSETNKRKGKGGRDKRRRNQEKERLISIVFLRSNSEGKAAEEGWSDGGGPRTGHMGETRAVAPEEALKSSTEQ